MKLNEGVSSPVKEAVKLAYDAMSDKKGIDISVLDISELSSFADYFIISSGNNTNHVKTIAEAVEEKLEKSKVFAKHKEGLQSAAWILLDYGDFIVHIFGKEDREFYNIEHIWGDAVSVEF